MFDLLYQMQCPIFLTSDFEIHIFPLASWHNMQYNSVDMDL